PRATAGGLMVNLAAGAALCGVAGHARRVQLDGAASDEQPSPRAGTARGWEPVHVTEKVIEACRTVAALHAIARQGDVRKRGRPAGHVHPTPTRAAGKGVDLEPRVEEPVAAEGLVVLDPRVALQREGAVRADAAAGRLVADGNIVLNVDPVEGQVAVVGDGPAPCPRPAALQRQVAHRQRGPGSHVEQAERWRPGDGAPFEDVTVAEDGQVVA